MVNAINNSRLMILAMMQKKTFSTPHSAIQKYTQVCLRTCTYSLEEHFVAGYARNIVPMGLAH